MLFIAKFIEVHNDRELRVFLKCKHGDNIVEKAKDQLPNDHQNWRMIELMIAPKCEGCKYESCSQLDHMGAGGCLE